MVKGQELLRHKKWLHSYHVVGEDDGYGLLYEPIKGIVKRVSKDHLARNVLNLLSGMKQEFWVTADDADKIAKSVIYEARLLDKMPPALLTKSEPGLAFHRLPFDIEDVENPVMPVFEELLGRASSPDALCAFIGSIFSPKADRQQYLWIYGAGENGKSSLMRFLGSLLGPAYHADEVEMSRDKYWTSAFVGRRLVAFPDCNSPCFPRSARFKGLTGSDAIRIEGKYDKAFSTTLDCKFMFLSNEELIISGEKADTRRAIYVKLAPISGRPDPKYDEKLLGEAKSIIAHCLAVYKKYAPNNESLPIQNPEEITQIMDDQMQGMLESGFEFGVDNLCKRVEFVQRLRVLGIKNPREVARIKRFIFEKMGVFEKRPGSDGDERKCFYIGIKTKENMIFGVPNYGHGLDN